MNTVDIPLGTPVFVRWYGKTLQGEVVPDDTGNRLFDSMLHVRIPVQGTPVIAVFTPAHVYTTFDNVTASATVPAALPAGSPPPRALPAGSPPLRALPAGSPAGTPALYTHRARYLQFMQDNWDHEHNHLQVSALEEFYALWRTCIALKRGMQVTMPVASAPKEPPFVAVDPGSPDGDHSATIIVDTETGEILPELPKAEPMPQPSHDIPKPTKKQLRSTGRIQYRDTIQTSIFD